jgi:hypothetical protein
VAVRSQERAPAFYEVVPNPAAVSNFERATSEAGAELKVVEIASNRLRDLCRAARADTPRPNRRLARHVGR